jgi:hypothetical protein
MKSNKVIIISAIVALLLGGLFWYFFFFAKSSKLISHVPKNAVVVGQVAVADLFTKLNFEKIKKEDVIADQFDKLKDEAPEFLQKIIESPTNSGIDFSVNPVIFAQFAKDDDNDLQFGILMAVDDKNKIKKLVEDVSDAINDDYTFREDKERNFEKAYPSEEEERKHAIAWNDDMVVLVFKESKYAEGNMSSLAEKIINLEEEESIVYNESLNQFMKNSGDIDVFVNMDKVADILKENGTLKNISRESRKIGDFLKNMNGASLHLNFNDNSVDLNSFMYYKNAEDAIKMMGAPIDKKFGSFISSNGNSIAVLGMSLNTEEMVKTMKQSGGSDYLNSQPLLPNADYSVKEMFQMLTGQLVVSLSDFKEIEYMRKEFDYESFSIISVPDKKMVPIINVQMGFNKSSDTKKIMELFSDAATINPNELAYDGNVVTFFETPIGELHLISINDRLILSNDPKAKKIKVSTTWDKPESENIQKVIFENPMGLYVSLNPENYPLKSLNDDRYSKNISELLSIFEDFSFTAMDDKAIAKLNLKVGEGNSLYRLAKGMVDANELLSSSNSSSYTPGPDPDAISDYPPMEAYPDSERAVDTTTW